MVGASYVDYLNWLSVLSSCLLRFFHPLHPSSRTGFLLLDHSLDCGFSFISQGHSRIPVHEDGEPVERLKGIWCLFVGQFDLCTVNFGQHNKLDSLETATSYLLKKATILNIH